MALDARRSYLLKQITNTLECLLNDFFAELFFHDLFKVREKNRIQELFHIGREWLLSRKTRLPLNLVIGVLLTDS